MSQPDRRENLLKEIDLIQAVIKRMASNSFLIKGWTVTLVVATLLLKGEGAHPAIAFIPLLIFWLLDAFYLRTERMYRELHIWVVANRESTDDHLFCLDAKRFESQVAGIIRTMFSFTLGWFYGALAFLLGVYLTLPFVLSQFGE